MRRLAKWQAKHGEGEDFTGRGAFAAYPNRWDGERAMKLKSKQRNAGLLPEAYNIAGDMYERNGEGEHPAEMMRREMYQRNEGGPTNINRVSEASQADSQVPMMRQV